MRKLAFALSCGAAAVLAIGLAALLGPGPDKGSASSHREAPAISEDPSADTTDLYAFRSLDAPDNLTIIANWIPGEDPAAGPNWYTFSPKARYNIYVDRTGDGKADVTYRFRFTRRAGQFFLGNTVQDYTVTRISGGSSTVVARGATPPNNIGPKSTPNYRNLAASAVTGLDGGGKVFAGQRDDAFFGDIGSIFDLINLRCFPPANCGGKDFLAGYAVHAIALQIPIQQLDTASHVVGVWATTDRQLVKVKTVVKKVKGKKVRQKVAATEWVQVSRLGNPLVNEAIIPTELKDRWNSLSPDKESQFERYYRSPILAAVMNALFPGVINAPESNRDDLVAVFLTGVPGVNNTGSTLADMLRINLSTPPTPAANFNRLGVIGGDAGGYPNGRRLEDDVIDIAERAVAGKLKGNAIADALEDGVDGNDIANLAAFPYEPDPQSGFDNTKGQQKP